MTQVRGGGGELVGGGFLNAGGQSGWVGWGGLGTHKWLLSDITRIKYQGMPNRNRLLTSGSLFLTAFLMGTEN